MRAHFNHQVMTEYATTLAPVAEETSEAEDREAFLADPELPAQAWWEGVIGVEGQLTGDGRLIEKGALRWENLPLPLRYVKSDVGMHDGAEVVGLISEITREGGLLVARGPLDLGSDSGREAYRQVKEGYTTGVSMDLDDVSFEIRVASELFEEMTELLDGDGEVPETKTDEEGRVVVAQISSDDEVRVTTDGRVRAATIVAIPAFNDARISISEESEEESDEDSAIVASGMRELPPAEWFRDPALPGPTPLTVTKDGRVYGHLALWGTCHTSHSANGECLQPPSSQSNYSHFRLGYTLTKEGEEIPTGTITLDTTHAGNTLNAASAAAHYDNTGSAAAHVAAGEDSFGIWLAGTVAPGADEEMIRSLRAAPLSGDWRRIGAGLDLVAVLAVNVPGFPVPRPSGLVASGVVKTLVASGMVPPKKVRRPGSPGSLSHEDIRYLKRLAAREKAEEQQERLDAVTQLAQRVRSSRAEMKVRAFAARRKE